MLSVSLTIVKTKRLHCLKGKQGGNKVIVCQITVCSDGDFWGSHDFRGLQLWILCWNDLVMKKGEWQAGGRCAHRYCTRILRACPCKMWLGNLGELLCWLCLFPIQLFFTKHKRKLYLLNVEGKNNNLF